MLILTIINRLFELYSLALVIYVLMSWFPNAQQSRFGQLLGHFCQPYLDFFDRFIPPIGGISFSPIVALIALQFIQNGLVLVVSMFF
ncbi:YggT family protein [Liquorilactobacillus nagelii]|uniref:YggT family protein n=1 Tax=Liquorilactobacillus nagelii TaxID=82688 RepID=UPI001CCE3EB3|nr:YggT family protein [Liquorilactobacillus nagelii]ULQ49760.1 YggT family protein [Liquorilactobacillus nagelii]